MRKYIKEYCDTCAICPLAKTPRHKPWGLLKQLEVPKYLWQGITIDFITDLPKSESSDTILVIVDRLTKMALFKPKSEVWMKCLGSFGKQCRYSHITSIHTGSSCKYSYGFPPYHEYILKVYLGSYTKWISSSSHP